MQYTIDYRRLEREQLSLAQRQLAEANQAYALNEHRLCEQIKRDTARELQSNLYTLARVGMCGLIHHN